MVLGWLAEPTRETYDPVAAVATSLLDRPLHPYTRGLLESVPHLDRTDPPLDVVNGSLVAHVAQ